MSRLSIIAKLGASVRGLRLRQGLSQEELAERAGLHRTYIAGIEGSGRNITIKNIDKLANALRVSTADLLSGLDDSAHGPQDSSSQRPASRLGEILFIEDTPQDVELTLRAFREARIANRVHVVRNGAEALDFLFCAGEYGHRVAKDRRRWCCWI